MEVTKLGQNYYAKLERLMHTVIQEKSSGFVIHKYRILRFQNRPCVPNKEELKRKIPEEAHATCYLMHPRGKKCTRI